MKKKNCIFCKIAEGSVKAHVIWEDEKHMAFLSIFPNTEGFSVVMTKAHYPSYNFDLADEVLSGLIIASKKVGKLLDTAFKDVGRTGLIMEGYGVDHVHTKLIPMHGTGDIKKWKPINSTMDTYFKKYPGYLSSHDCSLANEKELTKLAKMIRQKNKKPKKNE